MGRFRTTSKNEEPKDYNNYYEKKRGLATYKFLRTHTPCYNNAISDNIVMGNQCESKNIVNYKSYDLLINLSKISGLLVPNCSECKDIPIYLNNGINSEIYYEELELYTDDCCNNKTRKLFPYGYFNNTIKNPSIQIHSVRNIQGECEYKLTCDADTQPCNITNPPITNPPITNPPITYPPITTPNYPANV